MRPTLFRKALALSGFVALWGVLAPSQNIFNWFGNAAVGRTPAYAAGLRPALPAPGWSLFRANAAAETVRESYRRVFGREASDAEIAHWTTGTDTLPELVQRERDWLYQPGNPELTETVERAYAAYEPMAKFPEAKASAEFAFTRTAAVSGLTYADMVQDQQHLTALGLIFQHTLSRAPGAAEVSKYLPQLKANTQN